MTKADTTPKGNTVPPRTANAPADKDGQSAAQSNANGMTNGKGEPVACIASENDQPAEAGGVGGGGLNTTGMGANSVDGNNVGGRRGRPPQRPKAKGTGTARTLPESSREERRERPYGAVFNGAVQAASAVRNWTSYPSRISISA